MNNAVGEIRYFNNEEVVELIKHSASKQTCDFIRKNNIDGETFLALTEADTTFWKALPDPSKTELLSYICRLKQNPPSLLLRDLGCSSSSKHNRLSKIDLFKQHMPFNYLPTPESLLQLKGKYRKFNNDKEENMVEMYDIKYINNSPDQLPVYKNLNITSDQMVEISNDQRPSYTNFSINSSDEMVEMNTGQHAIYKNLNIAPDQIVQKKTTTEQHPGYKNINELPESIPPNKYDYIEPVPVKEWLLKRGAIKTNTNSSDYYLKPTGTTAPRHTYIEVVDAEQNNAAAPLEEPEVHLTIKSNQEDNTELVPGKKNICPYGCFTHLVCYSLLIGVIICFILSYVI